MMPAGRARGVDIRPFPARRRLVTGVLRAGRRTPVMHGLVQVDVTDAERLLHREKPPLSFTAFVIACVGRAVAAHREVQAYRDWRGRLVTARHVDIGTMVEVSTPDGPFPTAHLIRDADLRGVADISTEIRAVQENPATSPGSRLFERYGPLIAHVPGLMRLFYLLLRRSPRMRELSGNVGVSAVGMFGDGGGFGIPGPGIMGLMVVIGGVSERAVVVDGRLTARRVLDLTITVDHDTVDGAPAARFVACLRRLIEEPGSPALWPGRAASP
jgi:pyruvate/2-oxoglutarate dehydrogenase complex dihydrolipoamide acyltransferase (E2) component